ncbi:hypothetical protein SDJN03_14149, partial [Cucurbita argyrosperma subsp. sororia]
MSKRRELWTEAWRRRLQRMESLPSRSSRLKDSGTFVERIRSRIGFKHGLGVRHRSRASRTRDRIQNQRRTRRETFVPPIVLENRADSPEFTCTATSFALISTKNPVIAMMARINQDV